MSASDMAILYMVVPCYNEEEVLPESARVLRGKLLSLIDRERINPLSRLLLVDDGSSDRTWAIISSLCRENEHICALRLSRNRGHQNALMAGLVKAMSRCDMTVSIDADLQDDVDAIDEMVEKYYEHNPIVCGVRKNRDSDSFLKRTTAQGFYVLMKLLGNKSIYNHADFRLMSSYAVKKLARFGTEDLYLRGLVTRLDMPIAKVYYDRLPRTAGESKYSVKKMLALAMKGFESRKMQPAAAEMIGELYIAEEIWK